MFEKQIAGLQSAGINSNSWQTVGPVAGDAYPAAYYNVLSTTNQTSVPGVTWGGTPEGTTATYAAAASLLS